MLGFSIQWDRIKGFGEVYTTGHMQNIFFNELFYKNSQSIFLLSLQDSKPGRKFQVQCFFFLLGEHYLCSSIGQLTAP
jgi:hypothetical protein